MKFTKHSIGKINFLPLIVLIVTLVILVSVAFSIRYWQKSNKMKEGLRLGEIAYQQQNWPEAARQFSYYLSGDSTNIDVLRKYAESQLKVRPRTGGNISQAVNSYRTIMRNDPDDADAVKNAAEIYLATGSAGESELILRDFLAKHPDSKDLHPLLAISLSAQNKTSEIEEAFAEYKDFETVYYPFLYSQYIKADKYQQAAELLKKIIARNPEEIQAYDLLARTVNTKPELFDNENALKWLNAAIDAAPENPLAYIFRARYYIGMKQQNIALSDLIKATEFAEDNTRANLQIASLYASIGNLAMARSICAGLYEKDPDNLEILNPLLNYAIQEGNLSKAVEITDNAMEKLSNTNQWDFIPTAIESYCIAKENEKASALIKEVEKTDTMPANVSYWKGLIAHNNENINEAISYFTNAIQLGFNNGKIKMMLADAYEKNDNTMAAITQIKQALNNNQNNMTALFKLAELYIKDNNYSEAESIANQILSVDPANVSARILLLQASVQSADREKLKNDNEYYSQMMKKVEDGKLLFQQLYQHKTLLFQLALMADKVGDAEAILAEIEKTSISPEQYQNLQIALLLTKGDQQQAMDILEKQIAKDPENVDFIIRQISLLVSNSQYESAHSIIDKALESNLANSNLALKKLYFASADLYIIQSQDNPEIESKAIEQLETLLTKIPNDVSTLNKLLSLPTIRNNQEKASQYIEKMKAAEGQSGQLWKLELAKIRLNNQDASENDIKESIDHIKVYIAANPGDYNSTVLLAMLYERNDQILLAANLWQEAYNNERNNIELALNACRCLQAAGKTKETDELIMEIKRRFPDDLRVVSLDITRLLRNGQNDTAENMLDELYSQGQCPEDLMLTLANMKMAKNDYESAHKIYDEIMKNDSYPFTAIASKASAFALEKNYEKAFELCDIAIEKFNTPQAHLLKARIYLDNSQNDLAIANTDLALKFENITPNDYINAATIYLNIDNIDKAREIALQAQSVYPDNPAVYNLAIRLLMDDQATYQQGTKMLAEALTKFPDNNQLKYLRARELFQNGTKPDMDQAVSLLNSITLNQPQNIQAWLMLGNIEFQRQQYQKVMDILYQALTYNPQNPDLLFLKANTEAEISPELAQTTLKTLQKINSSDANIALRLASIYIGQNNIKEAASLLETAERLSDDPRILENISLLKHLVSYKEGNKQSLETVKKISEDNPENSQPFIILAEMLFSDQKWQEISELVDDWLTRNPGNSDVAFDVLRIILRQRELSEAKELIHEITDKVLALEPGNVNALQIQASLLILENNAQNTQKALETYQTILKTEPDNTIAMNNLAWILSEEQNKPQEALELALRGLEIQPEYADLLDTTGVIYYRLGQYDKAVEMLNKCISLYNPTNPSLTNTFYHIGKAYNKLNIMSQKTLYLKKAVEYNQNTNSLSDNQLAEIKELLSE